MLPNKQIDNIYTTHLCVMRKFILRWSRESFIIITLHKSTGFCIIFKCRCCCLVILAYNMHAIKVLSAISTVILLPLLWPIARIRRIRELRLQSLFNKDIQDYPLNGLPLVLKQPFVSDIEENVKYRGGVKVIWGPPGSGKSAAMRRVLNDMKERKLIRGSIVITPPDRYEIPSIWFRNALSDSFGNILYTNELLSKLIPKRKGEDWYTTPPYVIVLDQLENISIDEHLERFIRTYAHDCNTAKSHVIFIICSDAEKVKTMLYGG